MSTATIPVAPTRPHGLPSSARVRERAPACALARLMRRVGAWLLHRSADGRAGAAGAELSPVPLAIVAVAPRRPGIVELYHHRRLDLVRLAVLLVDDLPTAEDVVQDAFAALLRRYGDQLAGVDDPAAYLRTSVVNAARSVLRRRRTARAHVPEQEGHAPPAEEYVLLHEEHQEVLDALGRLTRRQREVLVLRYWSDLTEAQIADTLGLSRGTVKSTASRALDALGRQIEAFR
ncbi:SigE family RNA polymerase sigma factor [Streptomyces sp. NPDC005708]|uniref:SigE family RNA polymerase sigma factor n=1 Tax=Streptomyces sp. NPDC005708 TaxID=3154564 RepID=UPI0033E1D188